MKDIISIRKAKPEDADLLTENNYALALESENLKLDRDVVSLGVHALLNNTGLGFYLIAEIDNNPVASLMITKEWSDWRNGMFWWIQSVYVNTESRRQGIYTKLYEHVKALASSEPNVKGFRLYVEKENLTALQTYKALGMQETYYKLFEELK